MKKIIISLLFIFLCINLSYSISEGNEKLIDTPTADILLSKEVQFSFVFEKEGSVANALEVGLFDWMTIGGGFRVLRLIGEEEADLEDPYFLARFQILPEEESGLGLAIGWDDSDYYIPISSGADIQVERGLYLVLSKQIFQQEYFAMKISGGLHAPIISNSGMAMFMGLKFNIGQKLSILMEGDDLFASNILSRDEIDNDNDGEIDERSEDNMLARLNLGLKFQMIPELTLAVGFRHVDKSRTERIFQIYFQTEL